MNREEVSEKARAAIKQAFKCLDGKNEGPGRWTGKITEKLCAEVEGTKLRATAHGVQGDGWGEWLYDVCWLKYDNSDDDDHPPKKSLIDPELDFLKEAVLIVESEFGNLGDIRDDFQKLLVGRALVRCMIWDDHQKGEKSEEIAEWLKEMVKAFSATAPDDFYLLAAYTDKGFRFWHIEGQYLPELKAVE